MEEVINNPDQFQIQFSAPRVRYTKDSKYTCRRSYDGKIFGETLTYRCRSCGEFKNPDKNSVCEKCSTQGDLFG